MNLSFPAIVDALMREHGLERADAERAARRVPGVRDLPPVAPVRDEKILEKEEQKEITKLFTAFGCVVRNLSQARASKQAPGLPDLWVTRRTPLVAEGIAWWWESKRQVGGKRSPDQIAFAEDCAACGVLYGFGDRYDAAKFLVTIGAAVEDANEPFGIRPALIESLWLAVSADKGEQE